MSKQPICIIRGKEVPGWLYGKLINKYGYETAGHILFKIRNKENFIRYAQAGMKAGWLADPTFEMEREKPKMLSWIEQNVKRREPPKKSIIPKKIKIYKQGKLIRKDGGRTAPPDSIKDLLKGVV